MADRGFGSWLSKPLPRLAPKARAACSVRHTLRWGGGLVGRVMRQWLLLMLASVLASALASTSPRCEQIREGTPPLCGRTERPHDLSMYRQLVPLLPNTTVAGSGNDLELYLPFMRHGSSGVCDTSSAFQRQRTAATVCPADSSRAEGPHYFSWVSKSLRQPVLSGYDARPCHRRVGGGRMSDVGCEVTNASNLPPPNCPVPASCCIAPAMMAWSNYAGASKWQPGFLTPPKTLAQMADSAGQALSMCNANPQTPGLAKAMARIADMIDALTLRKGGLVLGGPVFDADMCICPNDASPVDSSAMCVACPHTGIRIPSGFFKLVAHRDGARWRTWTFLISVNNDGGNPLQMLNADNLAIVERRTGLRFSRKFHDGAQSSWISADDIVYAPPHLDSTPQQHTHTPPSADHKTVAPKAIKIPSWVRGQFFGQRAATTSTTTTTQAPACGENRIWRSCGASCTATCADLAPKCAAGCVARCECKLGMVENQFGKCIGPEQCPNPGCPNGKYRWISPATSFRYCLACEPGRYGRAVRGEGFCEICPPGQFTDKYGEHDRSDSTNPCKTCATGRFANTFRTACESNRAPLSCVAGKYRALSRHTQRAHCYDCPAGKHGILVLGAATCFFCPSGHFQAAESATECLPCPEGTHSAPYRTKCLKGVSFPEMPLGSRCPSGAYLVRVSRATGQSVCRLCPAGKFRGTAPSDTGIGCLLCRAGFHQPVSGRATCEPCPAGRFSSAYRTYCSTKPPSPLDSCAVGRFRHESAMLGKDACFACPAGKFGLALDGNDDATGRRVQLSFCQTCGAGRYQPNEGMTACSACPAGKHSSFYRARCTTQVRRNCPRGKYRERELDGGAGGLESLAWAGARSSGLVPRYDEGRCVACPKGKFGTLYAGEGECRYCFANHFTKLSGQTECMRCPAGRAASIFRTRCVEPTDARPCPIGSFKYESPVLLESECIACPPGKYGRASTCVHCEQGRYQDRSGAYECKRCPVDKSDPLHVRHCTAMSATGHGQIQCEAGRFRYESAITKTAYCYACPSGKFSVKGASSCGTTCPAGHFTHAHKCYACGRGTYQPLPGQRVCLQCRAGRHTRGSSAREAALTETEACTDCPGGQYQPKMGQVSCVACAIGRYSTKFRKYCSSSPRDTNIVCPAGMYHAAGGRDVAAPDGLAPADCLPCQAGRASPEGADACTDQCPNGMEEEPKGSGQCTKCAPGRHRSVHASQRCLPCAEGQYQPKPGAELCARCPGAFHVVPGSNATRCEPVSASPTPRPTPVPTPRCLDSRAPECLLPAPPGCRFVNDDAVTRINNRAKSDGECPPYPCGLRKCSDTCEHDVTPPMLHIHGPMTYVTNRSLASVEALLRFERPSIGYSCNDLCDGDITATAVASKWLLGGCEGKPARYDSRTGGVWGLKYTCTDASGLTATQCRVVTHSMSNRGPRIQLAGAPSVTVAAAKGELYTPPSATCSDGDGRELPITTTIFAPSGHSTHVGMRIERDEPGLFKIAYSCEGIDGEEAEQTRFVLVKDTTCPRCTLNDPTTAKRRPWNEREIAHFPFDPLDGVVCTDDMSSNVTVTTSGNVDLTVPGFYVIGYRAHDTAGNWNDGPLCPGGAMHYRRIIVVTSGTAAVARQHAALAERKGGKVRKSECRLGLFRNASGFCEACPVGTYSDSTNSTQCKECAAGKYQPMLGRSRCLDCADVNGADSRATRPGSSECARVAPPALKWRALPHVYATASMKMDDIWGSCQQPSHLPAEGVGEFGIEVLAPESPGAEPRRMLHVRCLDGFVLHGSARRMCQASARSLGGWAWNASPAFCRPDPCATETNPPPRLLHGQVVLRVNKNTTDDSAPASVVADIACDNGFGLVEADGTPVGRCANSSSLDCVVQRTCLREQGGRWSGDGLRCAANCNSPAVPSASLEGRPRLLVKSTLAGSYAEYSCKAGFAFIPKFGFSAGTAIGKSAVGRMRLECGADGLWYDAALQPTPVVDELPGRCWDIDCGKPAAPKHGTVTTNGTHLGSTAHFNCDTVGGYDMLGGATATCGIDGKWSTEPVCAKVRLCSHVRCHTEVFGAFQQTSARVVHVKHHASERHGDTHSCRFVGESNQCACLCYDSGLTRHAVDGSVKEQCHMQWNWQEHKCQCMPGKPAKWDLCFKGEQQHADFRQETPTWARSRASVLP